MLLRLIVLKSATEGERRRQRKINEKELKEKKEPEEKEVEEMGR